jgi:hypothetical protein
MLAVLVTLLAEPVAPPGSEPPTPGASPPGSPMPPSSAPSVEPPGDTTAAQVVECLLPAPFGPLGSLIRVAGLDAGGAGAIALGPGSATVMYSGPDAIVGRAVANDGALGAPRTVAATSGFVDRLQDNDVDVYFVDRPTGRLLAAPVSGPDGGAPRVVARSVDPSTSFHVDTACVYWVDARAGTITMVAK